MNDKQHNEELSNLAPKLASIKKKELHKCPEGYFDGLSDEVLAKILESPVLHSLEKKELLQAPEGYFEKIDERIKSIVNSDKTAKIIPIRTTILRWTAVAASVTVLIMSSFYFFGDSAQPKQKLASVETTHEEYTSYLMDELQDDELYAFVSENESSTLNASDEVVDYLIDETSDFELENIE